MTAGLDGITMPKCARAVRAGPKSMIPAKGQRREKKKTD